MLSVSYKATRDWTLVVLAVHGTLQEIHDRAALAGLTN